MYQIIHVDESYFILIKHSVNTKWQSNKRSLWDLKFTNKHSKPICPLRTSNWTDFKTPKLSPNWQSSPVTPKLAPPGLQNELQSDTTSINYPALTHSKTDSDFGLLMAFLFDQIFLDLKPKMASKCIKFYITSKHSHNIKHQKCIDLGQFNKESSIYMSAKKVYLERLQAKSIVDLHLQLVSYQFLSTFKSILGSILHPKALQKLFQSALG